MYMNKVPSFCPNKQKKEKKNLAAKQDIAESPSVTKGSH